MRLIIPLLLTLATTPALSAEIDANNFAQGTDVSNIDPTMTLSLERVLGAGNVTFSPVIVGTNCGILLPTTPCGNILASTNSLDSLSPTGTVISSTGLAALRADFNTSIYEIDVSAVNNSSDPLTLFVYDTQGNLIGNPFYRATSVSQGEPFTSTFNDTFSSSVAIGSVLIGGISAQTFVTKVVGVPEPSTLAVLAAGLLCVGWRARRLKQCDRQSWT